MKMKEYLTDAVRGRHTGLVLGILLFACIIGYSEVRRFFLVQSIQGFNTTTASTTAQNGIKITEIEIQLESVKTQITALLNVLQSEQNKSSAFQEQIGKISSTIGTLDKLSQTDPELLQKYSKVYFLNEHYTPPYVVDISSEFLFSKDKPLQIHSKVKQYLEDMVRAARKESAQLQIISAYRSFGTQASLKTGYKVIYGSGTANQFSADQGYSEHQLGTTVDITTPTVGATFSGFDKTTEFVWLKNNAHRYGFVLSYPPNNSYYQYEPWHWRFVGVDLSHKLFREGKYFYDLDQREIDNYLALIFE